MKKILIVDDSNFMRGIIKGTLIKGGFEICGEANNGKEAIEKYKELKPDIVTLDITMSEMDGISACEEIIKINPDAKIIMCSAMGQKILIKEAIQAGAKDFIIKPFNEDKILKTIKNVCDLQ